MGNWYSKVAAPWHCVRCASTYTGVQTIHSVATVTRGTMSELERATLPANTVNTPTICRQVDKTVLDVKRWLPTRAGG